MAAARARLNFESTIKKWGVDLPDLSILMGYTLNWHTYQELCMNPDKLSKVAARMEKIMDNIMDTPYAEDHSRAILLFIELFPDTEAVVTRSTLYDTNATTAV